MMGMKELTNKLSVLKSDFLKVYEKLGISEKLLRLDELEKQVADPEIWKDVQVATEKNQ